MQNTVIEPKEKERERERETKVEFKTEDTPASKYLFGKDSANESIEASFAKMMEERFKYLESQKKLAEAEGEEFVDSHKVTLSREDRTSAFQSFINYLNHFQAVLNAETKR